ncbi:MAG: DsbE family thiol:disulfide interchange protein [Rhodospirillales bacterium]
MRKGTKGLLFALPTLVFVSVAVGFFLGLDPDRDPSAIPSPLIDQPAPEISLPAVEGLGLPGLEPDMLKGSPVTVVNLWASWCAPCRIEHPQLMALAEESGVRVLGIDYKDRADKAVAFLRELGNPFEAVGFDQSGRGGIDWGITGVPETFFLDRDGQIRHRHVGPIDADTLKNAILPKMREIAE